MATAALVETPSLELTTEQADQVVAAAGEVVRASVLGAAPLFADLLLAGAADLPVAGAFVSLKRGGHLRSCCGGLVERPMSLLRAVHDAAVRTALEDVRFPPVSPVELGHLDMEVWLLLAPQRVTVRGEDRVAAVTVGRHGLVVERGGSRGLLLPGVAVDHEWDARRFLDQVCVKAGLHPTLWKDDDTTLLTFEGVRLRGRVPAAPANGAGSLFRSDELAAYADFCRRNVAALLDGATPDYYLFGVSDANVHGAALTLRRPGAEDGLSVSHLSLRPGVPLQATLFNLAQAAARELAGQGHDSAVLGDLEVSIAVFHDPAMHGTVADPLLEGVDAGTRAVLVMERTRSGVVYDAARRPEELVTAAAEQARVRAPDRAAVFSLQAQATAPRVLVSTAPRPTAGPAVRPPGVAGRFYSADATELFSLVDDLLGAARGPAEAWPAALVPHAGLIYSGHVAAAVFKQIRIPRTVLVLGPKHTPLGVDWAVAPYEAWALPGARVAADPAFARELAAAIPGLELDAQAHQREHAIEVELPFLARVAPESRVVGIALDRMDLDTCRSFARGLADVLGRREDRPLLLVSSDMNHFATDAENRRLDGLALDALERLDPALVYNTVMDNDISMCGLVPAVIVLETLRLLGGLTRTERVAYATSADTTGDTSRVVGYAGMLFG